MNIEDPIALHFIMQDDLYLLNEDKNLYNDSAIPSAPAGQSSAAKFNYLGKGKKKFLVLVHYPGHEFIADVHLAALDSTLKRRGYTIDDVAIVNMANHARYNYEEVTSYFKPEKILFLGERALPAAMAQLELNQPRHLDGCMVLYSFSFDEMMGDNDRKKAFWEQMKIL